MRDSSFPVRLFTLGSQLGEICNIFFDFVLFSSAFWKVGIGTFGRVFQCWDHKRKRCAAVKVVRDVPKYSHSSLVEAEILKVIS